MARPSLRVINPAIYDDEEWRDRIASQCLTVAELDACLPRDNQIIADEGTWIIVKDVPYTALEFDVPIYSIWRARRHDRKRQFRVGRTLVPWPLMLAEIQTPGGDLVLYPSEYVTTSIEKWIDLVGDGVTVNFMGAGEPGDLSEQMFYLMAHGIPRAQALLALLPSLTDDRFVYLTLEV